MENLKKFLLSGITELYFLLMKKHLNKLEVLFETIGRFSIHFEIQYKKRDSPLASNFAPHLKLRCYEWMNVHLYYFVQYTGVDALGLIRVSGYFANQFLLSHFFEIIFHNNNLTSKFSKKFFKIFFLVSKMYPFVKAPKT